ncbi:MAG TPA: response regulator [Gemmatimonadales bacterium]|nr:response regulator [Gemmatimonadales bacterium]
MAPAPLVLVVDDEPLLLQVCTRALEAGGYRVLTADSAVAALDILSTLATWPDLLLSDVRMVPIDGLSLVKLVRQAYPGVPALLMSGYTPDVASLPAPLVAKPFHPDVLLAAVHQALRTASPSQPESARQ